MHTALQEQGTQVAKMMVNIGFGEKGQEEEQQARSRQFAGQSKINSQGSLAQDNKIAYQRNNPWNQVDLRV